MGPCTAGEKAGSNRPLISAHITQKEKYRKTFWPSWPPKVTGERVGISKFFSLKPKQIVGAPSDGDAMGRDYREKRGALKAKGTKMR